jgi:hypothetical protein
MSFFAALKKQMDDVSTRQEAQIQKIREQMKHPQKTAFECVKSSAAALFLIWGFFCIVAIIAFIYLVLFH